MGIKVLPPDVNASTATFTPVGEDIRFGMAAVRNVGTAVVESIVAARKSKGAFASFADFLRKVPVNVCNKRVIESLIKAGRVRLVRPSAQGPAAHPRAGDRHRDRRQAQRGDRPGLAVRRGRRGRGRVRRAGAGRRVGQGHAARRSSARCSACTCPTTRCSASSTCWRPRPTARSRSCSARPRRRPTGAAGRPQRRADGHRRRASCPGCPQGHQAGRALGRGHAGGPRGRDRGAVLPRHLPGLPTLIIDDAIVLVKGRLDRREEVPKLVAMEVSVPELTAGEQGPFVVSIMGPGACRRWSSGSGRCCGPTRGRRRCTCGC